MQKNAYICKIYAENMQDPRLESCYENMLEICSVYDIICIYMQMRILYAVYAEICSPHFADEV